MNVSIAFERFNPTRDMPWFEEYEELQKEKQLCKVYNDGSSYVAIPQASKKKRRSRTYCRDSWDDLFDELYDAALKEEVSDIFSFIKAGFDERFPEVWGIYDFIIEKLAKVERNLWARKKRFRRKAYLNKWNYFVTFTYNDKIQDEESFKKGLRKCLSNLHTRRGWNYMGVWERSPVEKRLHFHALLYVPDNQMPGIIYERRDYSTKQHKMITTHPNSFFEANYGRCDFEKISDAALRHGNTLGYILKYIEKTNERIIYSRGIPSDFFMNVGESDICAEFTQECNIGGFAFAGVKYVLFDDVVDYYYNVLHKPKPEYYVYKEHLPS